MTAALRASAAATDLSSVDILGVKVSTASFSEVARGVVAWATRPTDSLPRFVSATSVHGLIEATGDPAFRDILNGASRVTPDGMPLVWFGRLCGRTTMERVYGPTLMKEVCRQTAGRGVRHFFYGGARGVPEELAWRLQAEFPGLEVAGTLSPPFRPLTESEVSEIVTRINVTGAEIVWVGVSTPEHGRGIARGRA